MPNLAGVSGFSWHQPFPVESARSSWIKPRGSRDLVKRASGALQGRLPRFLVQRSGEQQGPVLLQRRLPAPTGASHPPTQGTRPSGRHASLHSKMAASRGGSGTGDHAPSRTTGAGQQEGGLGDEPPPPRRDQEAKRV